MRVVYLITGMMSLFLAIAGVALPILPTTPFLLLSSICFAKSSIRFEEKLKRSDLYNKYVGEYVETKRIPLKRKKEIYFRIIVLMLPSIILAPFSYIRLFLIALLFSLAITCLK